jgi:hypothetical protein
MTKNTARTLTLAFTLAALTTPVHFAVAQQGVTSGTDPEPAVTGTGVTSGTDPEPTVTSSGKVTSGTDPEPTVTSGTDPEPNSLEDILAIFDLE